VFSRSLLLRLGLASFSLSVQRSPRCLHQLPLNRSTCVQRRRVRCFSRPFDSVISVCSARISVPFGQTCVFRLPSAHMPSSCWRPVLPLACCCCCACCGPRRRRGQQQQLPRNSKYYYYSAPGRHITFGAAAAVVYPSSTHRLPYNFIPPLLACLLRSLLPLRQFPSYPCRRIASYLRVCVLHWMFDDLWRRAFSLFACLLVVIISYSSRAANLSTPIPLSFPSLPRGDTHFSGPIVIGSSLAH
jgi:hypothetical protein